MDFLDFIRKVAEEKKERDFIQKGGPGSGWHAPPKGTHVAGEKTGGEKDKVHEALATIETKIAHQDFESAVILDSDGNLIFHKIGGKSSVSFTSSEIAKMGGKIFTHNHPPGNGFSPEDVLLASHANVKELRVIGGKNPLGKQYTYTMKPEESKSWPSAQIIRTETYLARQKVIENQAKAIETGKISKAHANAEHWHEVWTVVFKELGLNYSRREVR